MSKRRTAASNEAFLFDAAPEVVAPVVRTPDPPRKTQQVLRRPQATTAAPAATPGPLALGPPANRDMDWACCNCSCWAWFAGKWHPGLIVDPYTGDLRGVSMVAPVAYLKLPLTNIERRLGKDSPQWQPATVA